MATLWSTFTFWEQALLVAIGAICVAAVAGWILAICADAFDQDLPP